MGDKTKLTNYLSTLKIEIGPKQIQQIQNTGPSEGWEDSWTNEQDQKLRQGKKISKEERRWPEDPIGHQDPTVNLKLIKVTF